MVVSFVVVGALMVPTAAHAAAEKPAPAVQTQAYLSSFLSDLFSWLTGASSNNGKSSNSSNSSNNGKPANNNNSSSNNGKPANNNSSNNGKPASSSNNSSGGSKQKSPSFSLGDFLSWLLPSLGNHGGNQHGGNQGGNQHSGNNGGNQHGGNHHGGGSKNPWDDWFHNDWDGKGHKDSWDLWKKYYCW